MQPGDVFALLCDNLNSQIAASFKEKCFELLTYVYNLPPCCRDMVQPVDAGYGRAVKRQVGIETERHLEDDDNLGKWETGKYTASERRVLITKWVAAAVKHVNATHDVWRYFQRAGALLTVDGKDDDRVTLEGGKKGWAMPVDALPLQVARDLAAASVHRAAERAAAAADAGAAAVGVAPPEAVVGGAGDANDPTDGQPDVGDDDVVQDNLVLAALLAEEA